MKNIILFIFAITLVSCAQEPKDYATFSGKITNSHGNEITVRGKTYTKKIKMADDGTFSDTLHLKATAEMFSFTDGNEFTSIFLKNGDNLNLTLDTKEFDETVKFTGNGSTSNNYIAQKSLFQENLITASLFDLDEKVFNAEVIKIKSSFSDFIAKAKNVDAKLIEDDKKGLEGLEKELKAQYKFMMDRKAKFVSFIGNPSPIFENYENYKGGTTSLSDLKGKYVYVDVWATWCGPCKAEIPALKEIEKAYHGKNIAFVSISVDNGRGYKDNSLEASKEGWKKMIAEKEMGGIQLFSDKAWKSDFVSNFKINGIPRFILIDDKGNVVHADAPRPSSPRLKTLLTSLPL
jgi:thiol-disulfide isomerase/thioredoxin